MKKRTPKKSVFRSKNVKHSFTGTQLRNYAGLSPMMKYINKIKLGKKINELFPTVMHNSTKFSNAQVLVSVVLASFSGINRLMRIAMFTRDALIMALLNLQQGLNKDVISVRLKELGQAGAIKLQEYLFGLTTDWLTKSQLNSITVDADSTVKTVYGNQEGAAKGFNSKNKGAKSYHPLLAFVSELKIAVNTWFRTGSAYTSNGICEFIKQTKAILPPTIKRVFFRADSGFFSGALFDLLESQNWQIQKNNPDIAICEFDYKGKGWKKTRKLRAIRTIAKWVEVEFMGKKQLAPVYQYACYCSNLNYDALKLHEIYKQRSTSETWI